MSDLPLVVVGLSGGVDSSVAAALLVQQGYQVAGVMLRLWMPLFVPAGVEFLSAYVVVAWLCWIPNLLVAEWMIRRRRAGRVRAATAQVQRSSSVSEG